MFRQTSLSLDSFFLFHGQNNLSYYPKPSPSLVCNSMLRILLFNNTVTVLSYTCPHSWVIRIFLPFWFQFGRILSSKRSSVLEAVYYCFVGIFVWLLLLFTTSPPCFLLHISMAFPNFFSVIVFAFSGCQTGFYQCFS